VLPALYWHVKLLARPMALDEDMLKAALQHHKRGTVRSARQLP
jgi:hypothetical protein